MQRYLRTHRPGQSLITVVVLSTVLFLLIGFAIDGGLLYMQRRLMQNMADTACLTASNKLSLGNTDAEARTAAQEVIAGTLGGNAPGTLAYTSVPEIYNDDALAGNGTSLTHGIEIDGADVRVALQSPANTFFMRIAGIDQYTVSGRAHCNTAAGGGASPFTVARWRALPGSSGLTTDLPIDGQKYANTQMEVYDVLRHDGGNNEFISNWPGWGSAEYPGNPELDNPCCLYSSPGGGAAATIDNPGPWTPLAGQEAAANTGATSFVGSVLLDLRQISFADKLAYNGLTPSSSTDSMKDYVTRWIRQTYPGPIIIPGQQLAWVSGVNSGTIVKEFFLRHKPNDLVTMLVYNGTVYSNPDYKVYYPPGSSPQQTRSNPGFTDPFPPNCDIGPYTGAYIFDGSSVDPAVGTTPASYQFKVEPLSQPGEPGTPILNYRLRAFLSTSPDNWGDVQGRWRRSAPSAWGSGWINFNVNGTAPTVVVSRLDSSTWPFTFDLQQSETDTCTATSTDPLSPTNTITTTAVLPLRYAGAESVYLEVENQNGKRRALYALINMGAASNDFYAYIPGEIAYTPINKPTGGAAVKQQVPFIIRTVGGTDLIKGDSGLSYSFTWFDVADLNTPIAQPTGISADLDKVKVGGAWTNRLVVSVGNSAATARQYFVRVNVTYQPSGGPARTHWAWYYVELPDPLNSSVDSFVYALGYAAFRVTNVNPYTGNVDVNTIWGRAVSGLARTPSELKIGLLPRLVPWE